MTTGLFEETGQDPERTEARYLKDLLEIQDQRNCVSGVSQSVDSSTIGVLQKLNDVNSDSAVSTVPELIGGNI